jgi:hypothetical protein
VGTLIAAGLAAPSVTASVVLVPWLVGAAAILLFVLVGLKAGRAPGSAYCALVGAPLFVLAKPFHAWRVLRFRGDTWVRTERA